jgi:uncharacterized protein YjiS (DUF1127 family)
MLLAFSKSTLPQSGAVRSRPSRLRAVLADLFETVLNEIQVRRSLRELGSYDDAMLHDMGITRGELEGAVRHGRRKHETPSLESLAGCSAKPSSWTEWR